jgi:hypothetical protein
VQNHMSFTHYFQCKQINVGSVFVIMYNRVEIKYLRLDSAKLYEFLP